MANLIPPEAQKNIRTEYITRAVTIWLIMCGGGCLTVAILLTPVYVLITGQIEAYADDEVTASAQVGQLNDIENVITESNSTARLLLDATTHTHISTYIEAVRSQTDSGIVISLFSGDKENGTYMIAGIADTRQALARFKDKLEESPYFANAELPLSSLASERDIDFSITLLPEVITP